MGAWGDRPMDNDGSADMFFAVGKAAANVVHQKFIRAKVDVWRRWERVGLLQTIVETAPGMIHFLQGEFKTARSDIDEMLQDEDFIESWKNPVSTTSEMKKFRRQIETILSKM